jgi:menaquinol-cytochrome c reductase iron-sulfur subunit
MNNGKQCSQSEAPESPGRRKLLGGLVAAINVVVFGVILAPVAGFIGSPLKQKREGRWVPVLPESELAVGQTREVTYKVPIRDGYRKVEQQYSLFLRRSEKDVVAFDPACTHLGCRVHFQDDMNRYFCPCHGGLFDDEGAVISGPPPRALDRHPVKVEDGQIWVYQKGVV